MPVRAIYSSESEDRRPGSCPRFLLDHPNPSHCAVSLTMGCSVSSSSSLTVPCCFLPPYRLTTGCSFSFSSSLTLLCCFLPSLLPFLPTGDLSRVFSFLSSFFLSTLSRLR